MKVGQSMVPAFSLTRGPYGWTCTVRGAGGGITGYGFGATPLGADARENANARGEAVRRALLQVEGLDEGLSL